MKKIFFVTFLLFIFSYIPLLCQESRTQPIKIGIVELEYWGELDPKTGNITGIYPTIFKELFKRLNIKTIYTLAPYPRIMKGLKTGQFDLTITLPDNDTSLIIGKKVWIISLGVLSRIDNPVVSLDQLTGMKVGIIRGANFEPGFDMNITINKIESVHHKNLLSMLDMCRIDAIASDLTILNGLISKNGKTKSEYANQLVVNELSLHVLLFSKSPYLYLNNEINRTISQMIEDGTIERIIFQFIQ